MARSAEILVDACAWAGTGNVLKIQQMLQICSEHAVDFSAKKKEEVPEEEEVSEETEEVSTPGPEPELSFPTPIPPPLTPGLTPTGQGMEIDQPTQPETPATATAPTPAAAPTPNSAPAFVSEEEERKLKEAKQEKELKKQGIAVIGIALVAMGEEVGAEMALRHFQHLVRLLLSFFFLLYPFFLDFLDYQWSLSL